MADEVSGFTIQSPILIQCRPMPDTSHTHIAVIGAGPAGLMAAEVLSQQGHHVVVYEAKPSVGRKFLRAGIGGLNITHAESYTDFLTRYGSAQETVEPMLGRFPPAAVRTWVESLGIPTFEGSSGKVFPQGMKAAPLLRAWVARLRGQGVEFRLRHRWVGWNSDNALLFESGAGTLKVFPRAVVLTAGGASWPQLGSDGAWVSWLQDKGVTVTPLQSANCGFDVAWSEHLRKKFAGTQLKSVKLQFTDESGGELERRGELIISEYGVEGSLIYHFSRHLRECVQAHGSATFTVDLAPERSLDFVRAEVQRSRGSKSLSSHLKSRLCISGVKMALLWEALGHDAIDDPLRLAQTIKALPITVTSARPLAEAISTAGGVELDAVDNYLMLKALPGVFVAGEMLDWEAPTGGYLLTACLAQGRWAGEGLHKWLILHPNGLQYPNAPS